jgi:two-component system, chemotaxis family, protein-glutamate methylesterase/glutaminase
VGNLRVLVVEDSLTVRKRLVEVLSGAAGLEVVGEAEDGRRAIELCQTLRPDVVTMDMMLPVMTGLAATEFIMAHCPTPVLVVSASTNRGELFRTYDALAAGEVDVLDKPLGVEPDAAWEQRLVAAVRMVARIRVITHPRGRLGELGRAPQALAAADQHLPRSRTGLVALGASTGGPGAVVELLRALPARHSLPFLLVLHIAPSFSAALAEWLDAQSAQRVTYAVDGEPLASVAGRVVMAPPDRHMVVDAGRVRLTSDPERHSCRPAVDVLFESVARNHGAAALACLLTGMGKDGARGLRDVRLAGGLTLAQDEATSVVWGMPGEAVALGAAASVLPLGEIAAALARAAQASTSPAAARGVRP